MKFINLENLIHFFVKYLTTYNKTKQKNYLNPIPVGGVKVIFWEFSLITQTLAFDPQRLFIS